MNPVRNNLLLSVAALVIAAVAIIGTQTGTETGNIPWLMIGGFLAGSFVFAVFSWRKPQAKNDPDRRSSKPQRKDKKG